VRIVGRERDPATGVLGWRSVAEVSDVVRTRVGGLAAAGLVPVLAGGCRTLRAGARDALGPIGLAYVDGHLDLYDGQTSPTGEAADMPVAVIAGLGPKA
jgi:arginase